MFASADMSWYVEGVIRTYFNVLNHIRWADKQSMAKTCNKEHLRRYINNSEEIIFAEPFSQCIRGNGNTKGSSFSPIYSYLNSQRRKHGFTIEQVNEFCGVKTRANHYFGSSQFEFVTENHYNILR